MLQHQSSTSQFLDHSRTIVHECATRSNNTPRAVMYRRSQADRYCGNNMCSIRMPVTKCVSPVPCTANRLDCLGRRKHAVTTQVGHICSGLFCDVSLGRFPEFAAFATAVGLQRFHGKAKLTTGQRGPEPRHERARVKGTKNL